MRDFVAGDRAARLSGGLRSLFRVPVYLYRLKYGWLLGHRFLLPIHVGRRTGLRRHTGLEVLEYRNEGPEAVVMSAFGRAADWLRNIEATPSPEPLVLSRLLGRRYDGTLDHRRRLVAQLLFIAFRRRLCSAGYPPGVRSTRCPQPPAPDDEA